jgi:hypothetical protein
MAPAVGILGRMVTMNGTLPNLLRLDCGGEARQEDTRQEELAKTVQHEASWIRIAERRKLSG